MAEGDLSALGGAIDHMFHLGAIYSLDADPQLEMTTNVEGTRNAVRFAERIGVKRFHHVSSIAAAGLYEGVFREDMFEEAEKLDHPYFASKHELERVVRNECRTPWRIYRPGIVVGDSRSGEMDKIDGPYYFFKLIQKMRRLLPPWMPGVGLEGGRINLVPVDFVVRALDYLAHVDGQDGRCFHLTDPHPRRVGDILNIFARAAHAPDMTVRLNAALLNLIPRGVLHGVMSLTPARRIRKAIMKDLALPDEILSFVNYPTRFDSRETERLLAPTGISVPPLEDYAWRLWDYWERRLDPDLFVDRSLRGRVAGRVVLITGGSSGIGLAAAFRLAAAGGVVIIAARDSERLEAARQEAERRGLSLVARAADITDPAQCAALVKWVDEQHGGVDILINNAGRSISARDRKLFRPPARFRTHHAGELFRRAMADDGLAARDGQETTRPCDQHVLDRHAHQRAAILGLPRLQGGARGVDPLRGFRVSRPGRRVHHDQHAAGADRDDRADEIL